jgi:hypothetical protein
LKLGQKHLWKEAAHGLSENSEKTTPGTLPVLSLFMAVPPGGATIQKVADVWCVAAVGGTPLTLTKVNFFRLACRAPTTSTESMLASRIADVGCRLLRPETYQM